MSLLLQSVGGCQSWIILKKSIYCVDTYIYTYVFKLKFGKGSVFMWIFQRVCGRLGWRFEIWGRHEKNFGRMPWILMKRGGRNPGSFQPRSTRRSHDFPKNKLAMGSKLKLTWALKGKSWNNMFQEHVIDQKYNIIFVLVCAHVCQYIAWPRMCISMPLMLQNKIAVYVYMYI